MGISGRIVVTTEQLIDKANQAETYLGRMQSSFEILKKLMDGTTSFWTGQASDAHRDRYNSRLSRIDEMLQRYREHISDLREMAGVYDSSNREVENAIDDLTQPNFD